MIRAKISIMGGLGSIKVDFTDGDVAISGYTITRVVDFPLLGHWEARRLAETILKMLEKKGA